MKSEPTLLGQDFPLPLDTPFSAAQAEHAGINRAQLADLQRHGYIRRMTRGVYVAAQALDTPLLRAHALRLVVPAGYVVTDESAGWLAGSRMILAPGAHRTAPPVSMFAMSRGHRLRNGLAVSGARGLRPTDIIEIGGVLATTPLRTALDLGRLRHRDRALAAMDQLLRLRHFQRDDLLREVVRFAGFRGVRQLRWLAPLADGRSESPGESALRLRVLQAGLPRPVPQMEIRDEDGTFLGRGDLVIEDLRLLVEYDGSHWHGSDRAVHDAARRTRIAEAGWSVAVFRRRDVFGQHQNAIERLQDAAVEARRALSHPRVTGASRTF